jgi:hypothetical protein
MQPGCGATDVTTRWRTSSRAAVGISGLLLGSWVAACGIFTETTTRTCAPDCASTDKQTNAYIEPGVTGLVGLGPYLFAGADADLILVPSGMALVSALHGQFGIRF